MPVIQAEQIDGLIKTTQKHIEKERMASIAQRLTKYTFKTLFQKNKIEITDGTAIQWNITTDHSNTAQNTGFFDTIAPATNLHQIQASIPFRHSRVHNSWDKREIAMNRSPARIYNYIKAKLYEMDISWFEHLEDKFWGVPSAGDDQSQFGISYWVYSPVEAGGTATGNFATTGTGDRVNLNLAAFSSGPGGVSRVTYPRISNWYQKYTNVTYGDLFTKMRTGFDEIDYESPVDYSKLGGGSPRFGIYCTQASARAAADECRLQNENIGTDLSYYDGKAMIRGTQITGVPKLNEIDAARSTAINPFYVLDWNELQPFALEGFAPYETTESGGANQPLTVTRVRYMTWNMRSWVSKTCAMFSTT